MLRAGLRALQGRKELQNLVKRVKATRDSMPWGAAGPPPLLVKVAPDITDADKSDIAAVALRLGIDGLVISNTTIQRPPKVAALPNGDEVIVPFLSVVSSQLLGKVFRELTFSGLELAYPCWRYHSLACLQGWRPRQGLSKEHSPVCIALCLDRAYNNLPGPVLY